MVANHQFDLRIRVMARDGDSSMTLMRFLKQRKGQSFTDMVLQACHVYWMPNAMAESDSDSDAVRFATLECIHALEMRAAYLRIQLSAQPEGAGLLASLPQARATSFPELSSVETPPSISSPRIGMGSSPPEKPASQTSDFDPESFFEGI